MKSVLLTGLAGGWRPFDFVKWDLTAEFVRYGEEEQPGDGGICISSISQSSTIQEMLYPGCKDAIRKA
ncbi:hypothetical protein Dda_6966 [Drechslerella dactyloides]|uniref:Uncharacterized protein n=1 Tax=Drechslerella dactyloides TaxID=74499 RepID=A0AAD6NH44_DREDA|nr:hypothetical protein Dda_6966 [Drechslerella dactyloides]